MSDSTPSSPFSVSGSPAPSPTFQTTPPPPAHPHRLNVDQRIENLVLDLKFLPLAKKALTSPGSPIQVSEVHRERVELLKQKILDVGSNSADSPAQIHEAIASVQEELRARLELNLNAKLMMGDTQGVLSLLDSFFKVPEQSENTLKTYQHLKELRHLCTELLNICSEQARQAPEGPFTSMKQHLIEIYNTLDQKLTPTVEDFNSAEEPLRHDEEFIMAALAKHPELWEKVPEDMKQKREVQALYKDALIQKQKYDEQTMQDKYQLDLEQPLSDDEVYR